MLNRASVERGMFRNTCWRSVRDHETRHGTDEDRFGHHDFTLGRRHADYSKVDRENGIVAPGTFVNKDDVLVCKSSQSIPNRSEEEEEKTKDGRDCSTVVKYDERAMVERVMIYLTKDDLQATCVQTSAQRAPEMGDKFSSMHAQKGLCGIIVPQEDMPWTADGTVYDLFLNNHAIPSRMTIGQLMETLLGKVACFRGRVANGTAFQDIKPDDINEHTLDKTFGKTVCFHGATGEQLKGRIFTGLTYYQRLKHLVKREKKTTFFHIFLGH